MVAICNDDFALSTAAPNFTSSRFRLPKDRRPSPLTHLGYNFSGFSKDAYYGSAFSKLSKSPDDGLRGIEWETERSIEAEVNEGWVNGELCRRAC
jgi:hypothetical protein